MDSAGERRFRTEPKNRFLLRFFDVGPEDVFIVFIIHARIRRTLDRAGFNLRRNQSEFISRKRVDGVPEIVESRNSEALSDSAPPGDLDEIDSMGGCRWHSSR